MSSLQTDNSYFEDKVAMRIKHLPKADPVLVLDAFSGHGILWRTIIQRTGREIEVTRLDEKKDRFGFCWRGDNLKFMKTMNLNRYHVIDLDSYGIPFAQLRLVLENAKGPVVHATIIQSQFGMLPRKLLYLFGYTKKMVDGVPTLFNRNGWDKIEFMLASYGVKTIWHRADGKGKHYVTFKT